MPDCSPLAPPVRTWACLKAWCSSSQAALGRKACPGERGCGKCRAEAGASRLQGLTQEQLALLALEVQRAAAQQAIVNLINNNAEPPAASVSQGLGNQGTIGGLGLETAGEHVQGCYGQPAAEEACDVLAGRLPQRRDCR